ncbi:MAG: DUF2911 domain-containing protein [Gemmatimonadales bacterium]|jgi:hypothetical protein|nr:MAG: DUF2911 domain-containing protein [Gemmatimonadales bacterium]
MKKMVVLAVAAVALALGVLVGVTGVAYLPVSIALGPCLRDWTSPSSYGTRASPLASTTFRVGSGAVRVCYGRPAARGRTVFGGLVPFGRLWRTGANEPTRLYTNTDLSIAGIQVPRGRYALYTVPGPERWEVRLSRSILHWGNDISPAVQSREIGHTEVPSDSSSSYVEAFTIRTAPAPGDEVHLILEWESTRVVIPIRPAPALGQ